MVCMRGLVGTVTIVDKIAAKIDFIGQSGAGTFATQWVYQKDFINLRVEDDEAGRRWWNLSILSCIFCILCFSNKCFSWILAQGIVRSCLLQQSFFLALRFFFSVLWLSPLLLGAEEDFGERADDRPVCRRGFHKALISIQR